MLNQSEIDHLCTIARNAGNAVMEIYDGHIVVEMKSDRSPLTAADRASHDVIVGALNKHFPGIPVLSEEGKEIPYEERREWGRFWLVDPLDGTKEFIKRNGEFTVNIALIDGTIPVIGVIYVPAQDKLYWGGKGFGAWMREGEEKDARISARTPEEGKGLTVVMSRSHPSPELNDYLKNIDVAEALSVGSSLKLCAVAEGKADLYPRLGPTMEWDTAAGQAIVEGADGKVLDLKGSPLTYNKENLLNPYFVVSPAR